MAEGLLRHLGGDPFEAYSAGTEATHIRPLAIRAMAEMGMDITGQSPKTLDRYLDEPFDEVITVCDAAAGVCPVFPNAKQQQHWSFPDPSKATGSEEEQLAVYRSVGDAIRKRIEAELLTTYQPERCRRNGRWVVSCGNPVWRTSNLSCKNYPCKRAGWGLVPVRWNCS